MIPTKHSRTRTQLLKYAGEFIIIFTSITFSWWFDAWRQEREDRTEEAQILKNLDANLRQDSLNLATELSYIQKTEYTFDDFLVKLERRDLQTSDSSGFLIRKLIVAPEFHPNSATFEAIKSTGELKLIQDDSLAQAIMNLYEVNYEQLAFLIDIYNRTSIETIWNYSIEHHDLTKVLGAPADRIYKLSFSNDGERKLLINKIMFSMMAISYTSYRTNQSLERIGDVRKRIRQRMMVLK